MVTFTRVAGKTTITMVKVPNSMSMAQLSTVIMLTVLRKVMVFYSSLTVQHIQATLRKTSSTVKDSSSKLMESHTRVNYRTI